MKGTDVPLTNCRICGSPNDRAASIAGIAKPRAGDLAICINCGAVAVYDTDLTLRAPTDSEREGLPELGIRAIRFIRLRGRLR